MALITDGESPFTFSPKLKEGQARRLLAEGLRAEMMIGRPEHKAFAQKLHTSTDAAVQIGVMRVAALEHTALTDAAKESTKRDVLAFVSGCLVWAELGYPVFNLTLDFFRALLVTDFGDVGPEVMHLPFPAFIIRCPEPLLEDTRGLFVYPVPAWQPDSTSLVIGKHDVTVPRAADVYPPPELRYHRLVLEATEASARRQAFTQWPALITFEQFLRGPTRRVETVDAIEAAASQELGTTLDPTATALARRVLGNLLLYVQANGGLPAVKRRDAVLPVEREHPTEPRFRVGRPVKLSPQLRQHLSAAARAGGAPAWKLAQRFVVRGHWRNQVHGVGRLERKRIWITPFWKGPQDLTQALERTFEVT